MDWVDTGSCFTVTMSSIGRLDSGVIALRVRMCGAALTAKEGPRLVFTLRMPVLLLVVGVVATVIVTVVEEVDEDDDDDDDDAAAFSCRSAALMAHNSRTASPSSRVIVFMGPH